MIVSAIILHPDLLSDPMERFTVMSDRANYYHPFLFGLIPYLIIGLFRLLYLGIRKIIKRRR